MKLGDVYRTAVKAADTELAEVLSAKYATGAPEERHFQLSRQEDLAASKATYESAALVGKGVYLVGLNVRRVMNGVMFSDFLE